MKKYIELTEYDNNGRTVIFADNIQGLCRVRDGEYDKEFTELIVSGYPLLVNEPIDEILEKMESDQGYLDCIEVGYELAMQKINKIRAEIEQAKDTDFQRNRKTYNKCLEIIDKYMAESEISDADSN